MVSVLFSTQTGSGGEVVCYFDKGGMGGGSDRVFNAAPLFFDRSGCKTPFYNQAYVVLKFLKDLSIISGPPLQKT